MMMNNIRMFYNTVVPVDTVPTQIVDYNNWCVHNPFTEKLNESVIKPCCATYKLPQYIFDDAFNKVGVVAARPKTAELQASGLPESEFYTVARDTAVFNLLQLRGWFDSNISLMQEIAQNQWYENGFKAPCKLNNQTMKLLFTDFLLRTSICYVEVLRDGSVEKFYATRNINLLMQLSTNTHTVLDGTGNKNTGSEPYLKVNKALATSAVRNSYATYLALDKEALNSGQLPYLKLAPPTKKTQVYNIVMPRGTLQRLNAKMQYRIMPISFVKATTRMIELAVQKGIVDLTFVKDNMQLRKFSTTTNSKILLDMCGNSDRVTEIMQAVSFKDNMRGYMKLPDITLLNASNCIRAVDIRITKIKIADNIQQYLQYKGVDITKAADVFRQFVVHYKDDKDMLLKLSYIKEIYDRYDWILQQQDALKYYTQKAQQAGPYKDAYLRMVAYTKQTVQRMQETVLQTITNNTGTKTAAEIHLELIGWLDYGVRTFSTAFLQQLHLMMLNNKDVFPNYLNMLQKYTNVAQAANEVQVPQAMYMNASTQMNLGDL